MLEGLRFKGGIMSRRNSAGRRTLLLLAFLVLTVAWSFGARAATSARGLYTLIVSDGYTSQKVPVYEYKTGNKITIAPGKDARTLYVNRASKKITVRLSSTTDYFRENYKTVGYSKTIKISSKKNTTIRATAKSGKKYSAKILLAKIKQPAIASLSLSRTSMTEGTNTVTFTAKARTYEKTLCSVTITNSAGKTVYKADLGDSKSTSYSGTWDGKANQGSNSYVPAGKYKIKVSLRYLYGNKYKFKSKTKTVTVSAPAAQKEKTVSSAADTSASVTSKVSSFTKTWPWKITLTGDDTTDYLAEYVCQKVLTPGMNEIQRARALYLWASGTFTRTYDSPSNHREIIPVSTAAAKNEIAAYGKQADALIASGKAVINNANTLSTNAAKGHSNRFKYTIQAISKQVGSCAHFAFMYEVLCRHAGLTADMLENNQPQESGYVHHYWNAVRIGSYYYWCDGRIEKPCNNNKGGTIFFLRGKNFLKNPSYGQTFDRCGNLNRGKNYERYKAIFDQIPAADCPGRLS